MNIIQAIENGEHEEILSVIEGLKASGTPAIKAAMKQVANFNVTNGTLTSATHVWSLLQMALESKTA